MMQITRAEIIAVTLPTSISDRSGPLLWILQSGRRLMLELTITSARQWSPYIAATVDCLTDITTINHRVAPRSLICCNATASWLFHREVFQAKLLAVGIPLTEKKLVASGACWFEFCLAWQRLREGDRTVIALRLQWRHNYDFCLTSVISSLRPRQHIEERLTLIIDFYHLLLRLF